VARALIDHVGRLPTPLRGSLTWDRGREMAEHAVITAALSMSNDQNLWVRRDVAHVSELVDWRSAMPVT